VTVQHQGNACDRITRYGLLLVVAARRGRHTVSCMFDGLADFGIDQGGKSVQEPQGRLDVEPFGVGKLVQSEDGLTIFGRDEHRLYTADGRPRQLPRERFSPLARPGRCRAALLAPGGQFGQPAPRKAQRLGRRLGVPDSYESASPIPQVFVILTTVGSGRPLQR